MRDVVVEGCGNFDHLGVLYHAPKSRHTGLKQIFASIENATAADSVPRPSDRQPSAITTRSPKQGPERVLVSLASQVCCRADT